MKPGVAFILNAAGGSFDAGWVESNRDAMETIANGAPIVLAANGDEIKAAVQRALDFGCTAIVAGGGDGTLNAVASLIIGSGVLFGILPLGTLNHFARDLGVPLEPDLALAALRTGHPVQVDVGEVNGRYFLNNSSLGLYPDIVHDRTRQQRRLGRGKWTAFAWAVWGALRRSPFLTVRLVVDGEATLHRTPFVFVGNNAYTMEGFRIGQRSGLTDGVLSVYVADGARRWQLVALGVRALFGKLRQTREFCEFRATDLRVETPRARLRVATDGEVHKLDSPFLYRIHAGALRVILPAAAS
jgi:diacylglycerol kinase family enzyme